MSVSTPRLARFVIGADNVTGASPSRYKVCEVMDRLGFLGCTTYPAAGMHLGRTEAATVVEAVTDFDDETLRRAASNLAAVFRQEAVLLVALEPSLAILRGVEADVPLDAETAMPGAPR